MYKSSFSPRTITPSNKDSNYKMRLDAPHTFPTFLARDQDPDFKRDDGDDNIEDIEEVAKRKS